MDLRNHGKSAELEGFGPPHDMVNAAKDLAKLIESQDWAWPDVVMGHSMGGKVALQFLESCNRGDYGNSASLPKQVCLTFSCSTLNFCVGKILYRSNFSFTYVHDSHFSTL